MAYRMGFPGWKLARRMGWPVEFRVFVHQDDGSGTYWAESPDLDGLVVSGETLEDLKREVLSAAESLLELSHGDQHSNTRAHMEYTLPLHCAA